MNKKGGGDVRAGSFHLDLDCVETVRFKNIDFVAKSGMRCDVNLKMTYFLRGKQFCIALKAHSAILLYHAT